MSGLIRFRWIAILALILGTFPLVYWGHLKTSNIAYFVSVLGLLAIFNALSLGLFATTSIKSSSLILVQLWVDLLAATGLLFVSGSAANPFTSILCIHSFIGGMLLLGWRSWAFGISVLGLLGFLQFETIRTLESTKLHTSDDLLLSFLSQWVLVAGSWLVSHYFSGLLNKKELKIRLLQGRQHQADRLKALGALTAGFSHQMATPMNALQLRMNRGLRKLENEDNQALDEFLKAETSLQECVEVFKQMASIFSHSDLATPQRIDLQQLVPDLLKVWAKENSDIAIEVFVENEALPATISKLAFSQTLFDLLDNAAEASSDGQGICCRLYSEDEQVVLEVIDKGPGVSQEIMSRIGEPFVTTKEYGNGLGLYSAGMMAQSVGGEFLIRNSTTGPGVIAQIRLPMEEETL